MFALGQFIGNTSERTDLANQVNFSVGMMVTNLSYDGSPIVRQVQYSSVFISLQDIAHTEQSYVGPFSCISVAMQVYFACAV